MTIKADKALSFFSLVMLNVIAVDNLRTLTVGAEYGYAVLFFYSLGALVFFIPTILVAAELATGWPTTGGVYVWVREAFGPYWGFFTIWLQWIYNVVWYPTIFAFMAGILAYLIDPTLVNNKIYMITVILGAFWGMTLLNSLGLHVASWVSIIGALIGTIFPMILIILLGIYWIYSGRPQQIQFSPESFIPNITHFQNLAFLTNIFFGLMGMEMSAVHAEDVHNPTRNYPRALFCSGIIIFFTLVLSCLAITIVIPVKQLNLVSGFIDAFAVFFSAYNMKWFIPIIAILIVIGSACGAAAWIMGPARGLSVACHDHNLPALFKLHNKRKSPIGILFIQGIIVSLLCLVFLIMPSVNSSYWILSNLTAQLALIFYILMFSAAIRLHHKCSHVPRAFKIPGNSLGIWMVCGVGILTCIGAIIVGFIPPSQVAVGKVAIYETVLIAGILLLGAPPFLFYLYNKKKGQITRM